MVLLTYFSSYIQLNYQMFTNNIIIIITITTTVLYFLVTLVRYLMHLL